MGRLDEVVAGLEDLVDPRLVLDALPLLRCSKVAQEGQDEHAAWNSIRSASAVVDKGVAEARTLHALLHELVEDLSRDPELAAELPAHP